MGGADRAFRVRREDEALESRLDLEVDRDRAFVDAPRGAVRGRAERDLRASREENEIARFAARRRDVIGDVGEPSDRTDDGRRPDVGAVRRVVQGHVA